ncbi:hypothetical protein K3729_09950 [Rhodobacteraceae bacterium S2214]|nr:hypothetical protein K3729_09950 [Rhodobacteraceae bacterium S2214]
MSMEWVFFAALGAAVLTYGFWSDRRHKRRKQSLRRDDSAGVYVWTDFDGSERRSSKHPEEPGGVWHSDSSSWGDFGGDGGGDGGGGD